MSIRTGMTNEFYITGSATAAMRELRAMDGGL
jgi:hypothetical protein